MSFTTTINTKLEQQINLDNKNTNQCYINIITKVYMWLYPKKTLNIAVCYDITQKASFSNEVLPGGVHDVKQAEAMCSC